MKVSYCITCKNRLSHIQATLAKNLRLAKDDPNTEFVLLNYQSDDGLADWVRATFADDIASGRLVHAYHAPAPHFRMAHAKNMAHRLASGDILCNLDADNVLPEGYSDWLRARFGETTQQTISVRRYTSWSFIYERIVARILPFLPLDRPPAGLFGRVAVTRQNFLRLGGYDETLSGWGFDDADFQLRGREIGLATALAPRRLWGDVIEHGKDERVANLSPRDRLTSTQRMARGIATEWWDWTRALHVRRDPDPNRTGAFGCGEVWINFASESRILEPLPDHARAPADADHGRANDASGEKSLA